MLSEHQACNLDPLHMYNVHYSIATAAVTYKNVSGIQSTCTVAETCQFFPEELAYNCRLSVLMLSVSISERSESPACEGRKGCER